MKKFLFFLSSLFVGASSFAQDIKIVDSNGNNIVGDTIFLYEDVDPGIDYQSIENKGFSTIINNSMDSMTIALRRYERATVPGTGDALCWGNTCYGEVMNKPVWEIGDTVRIAAGDTAGGLLGGFVTYHFPHANIGNSTYEYEFYDKENQFTTSTLFVQYRTTYQAPEIRLLDDLGNNLVSDTLNLTVAVDINDATQTVEFDELFEVVNYSDEPGSLKFMREELAIVNGTEEVVCWGDSCSAKLIAGSNSVYMFDEVIAAGALDSVGGVEGLKTTIYPNTNTGQATYKYTFIDTTGNADSSSVIVVFNLEQATTISEQSLDQNQLVLFPNPVKNNLRIELDTQFNGINTQVNIRDLTGKLLQTERFSANSNKLNLDVSSFESGIYFVSLVTENQTLLTKKLIVQ